MSVKYYRRYLLGEEVYDTDNHRVNPKYFFMDGNINTVFYDDSFEMSRKQHPIYFINTLLKLNFEIDHYDFMDLFHRIVLEYDQYYFTKTLLKYGMEVKAIVYESLQYNCFSRISKYLVAYEYDIVPYLKENIDRYINQGLDFQKYIISPTITSPPESFSERRRNTHRRNWFGFIDFVLLFRSGMIKTNEQFNELLYYTGIEKRIGHFKYMIFRKGKFVIDYNLLLNIPNKEIKRILDVNAKYWKK